MRMSLNVSAQLAGIEYWNILSGYMTRYYAAKETAPETFPLFRLLGASASAWIFPWMKPIVLRQFAVGFNRYRKSQGLEPVRDVLEVMESPHMNLIADLPAYAPCADLPENFRYVGPLIWEPSIEPPSWLDEIDDKRRTVYVTLGSTGDASNLRRMLISLMSAGYQVLATTGRTAVDIPDGVFACPYAPGSALLPRSDAVICHGGSLTVYQSILHGVPVVGIPTFHDQETNMDRVAAMGWGVEVSPGRWRQAEFLQAVAAATTGRFQASVLHGQQMLNAFAANQTRYPILATRKAGGHAAPPPSALV
jgi:UDP:flavonoid glycosyltransferase YjiC (YdhE family)